MKRSAFIDCIKLLASQLIVLHHLSRYAPMSPSLADAFPRLLGFIQEEGRLAVQPFLVIAGYLAAMALSKRSSHPPLSLVWQRYVRLAPPLLVALALVMATTLLVDDTLGDEDWLSPLPTLGQLLAQMFLLQDVLEIPSISAGAWYVAIDLQLYALVVLIAQWRGRAGTPLAQSHVPALVAIATIASIHVFSRDAALDAWAIYFLPAYGLGALVAWSRQSPAAMRWLLLTAGLLVVDWLVEPRVRPLLAVATAAALLVVPRRPWAALRAPLRRLVTYGSDLSYSIFVCHFAVIILASGLWMALELEGLEWAVVFTFLAWAGSWLTGAGVHALIERAGSVARRIALE